MTPEELVHYQNGFKVAINFLYHHHDEADKEKFEKFLKDNAVDSVVKEAIEMTNNNLSASGESCPPGMCPDGTGSCVQCKFKYAFDGTYIA